MSGDPIAEGRAAAKAFNGETGGGFKNAGRRNAYECERCYAYIVTVDREPGVTPFLTKCGNCGAMAQSKMYRVAECLAATHEWYRPDTVEGLGAHTIDHLRKGGLILRAIPGNPDEWRKVGGVNQEAAQVDRLAVDLKRKAEDLERKIAHAEGELRKEAINRKPANDAIAAFTVAITAPDAPACFSFKDGFSENAALQIKAALAQLWPMMTFTVDPVRTMQ